MSDIQTIAQVLEQSISAQTAKQAEQHLNSLESQEGFSLTLLHVVASNDFPISTRLAGSLFFKNLIKRKWIDDSGVYKLPTNDVKLIKSEIVSLFITLPDSLQNQIGESISIIAESEFPELWPELIDELVSKLSPDDMIVNKGVLKVAHSIFKRWRPAFRSDELFLEIKMVLDKFAEPFLNLLKRVDELIDQNSNDVNILKILFDNLLLLMKIYYDLNCQDIPAFFEDHLKEGMSIIHKYLEYKNPILEDNDEDNETDCITLVKTIICELIQLYTTRYEEEFSKLIPQFIQTIWNLLNNLSLQPKNDILASKSLQFLTAIASLDNYSKTLNSEESLKQITEQIILPNITLRESDEELFEDDPIEYTRRDLEGSDTDSRRRASTDFLRALKENSEHNVTHVVMNYINHYLNDYQQNIELNWKSKDIALYLFSAIAAKGSLTNSGVTSTNLLVDIVDFFAKNVASDLINPVTNPILKVDAVKYIFTFRNQLTKEQLTETFGMLSSLLNDDNYVVYTYTSITIEKILSLRSPTNHQQLLFNKSDITTNVFQELLMNLFNLMFKKGSTPEKLAENEFLMKCIMRICLTAGESLNSITNELLQQLLKIVKIISTNPSNPRFTHYTFESISVLIKFNHNDINSIMTFLIPSLLEILGDGIQEFIPYSFQILAYSLEILPKTEPLPQSYIDLIKPLVSPSVWEFRGNIPGVARLLSSIIKHSPNFFTSSDSLTPILGVFQKLISSKVNDHLGLDLLTVVLLNIPLDSLKPFLKEISMILLSRLQQSRTEKYVKRYTVFLSTLSCLNNEYLNSRFVIEFIDNVQDGLFGQILNNFIIPSATNFNNLLDRKIIIIGLLNLIVNLPEFNDPSGKYFTQFFPILKQLLKLVSSESIKGYKTFDENVEMLLELEHDDLTFGSSFNKLNVISQRPYDPIPELNSKQLLIDYFKGKLSQVYNILQNGIAGGNLNEEDILALQNIGITS